MAKINQIQNALKELGGGAFQNLADSYLLKKGYLQIISLGSISDIYTIFVKAFFSVLYLHNPKLTEFFWLLLPVICSVKTKNHISTFL
jgi:hypothetical protein